MITQEQDPDVVRWSRELFDCDPYNNLGFCGALVPSDGAHYYPEVHYFKNNHCGGGLSDYSNVGTDELGGCRSLEHEFSRFTVAEAAGSSKGEELERHLQASIYPPEWFGQSVVNHASEHESGGREEVDDTVPSSSCCSPGKESYCGEDWSYSLDLTDEYSLDGEMGKRLNQMASVPHVPRINGEIPSIDEATLDHQRLLERLQLYDLFENKVQGDGNCQFRALSDQFYRSPEHHEFVRQQVVNQLKSHTEIYEGYVPMAYVDYIEKMSKSGEWGDHVTLQAAADSYGIKIFVITSFKDTCYIEIIPNVAKSKRVICLSFWAEVHYNSIYPLGEEPVFETKKKRRWRIFRHKHVEPPDEFEQ